MANYYSTPNFRCKNKENKEYSVICLLFNWLYKMEDVRVNWVTVNEWEEQIQDGCTAKSQDVLTLTVCKAKQPIPFVNQRRLRKLWNTKPILLQKGGLMYKHEESKLRQEWMVKILSPTSPSKKHYSDHKTHKRRDIRSGSYKCTVGSLLFNLGLDRWRYHEELRVWMCIW